LVNSSRQTEHCDSGDEGLTEGPGLMVDIVSSPSGEDSFIMSDLDILNQKFQF